MALPVLKLNLAPPPTLWRQYHVLIAWGVLILGALSMAGAGFATLNAYRQAAMEGHKVVDLTSRRMAASSQEAGIRARMESIDVEKELPRWRLAEKILSERGIPWSRISAELERSLVQDVRIKNIQRTRDNTQKVQLKLKGEARNRAAEDAFIESLQKNTFFTQVILEREAESQGGGLEFDCILPMSSIPTPYVPLPKFGPTRAAASQSASQPTPQPAPRPVIQPVARPVPPVPQRAATPPRPASSRPLPQRTPAPRAQVSGRPIPHPDRSVATRPQIPEPSPEPYNPDPQPMEQPQDPYQNHPGTPPEANDQPTYRPYTPPSRRMFPSDPTNQEGQR